MTEKELLDLLEASLLRRWARALALDLGQCASQKQRTSKQERRERALAYLVETLTGSIHFAPRELEAIALVNLIEEVRGNVEDKEAKIGLERAEKRLRHRLSNRDFVGLRHCVACGEEYEGDDHRCTSREAAARDRAMGNDDSVKEVT